MNSDTPLLEYLIIGSHTSAWIVLLIFKGFEVPIESISLIDPAIIILILPFVYLIGMLADDLVFHPLNPFRKKIGSKIYDPDLCKDEMLAHFSQELYSAYEARVRRVRIIGVSIFNWPLLGLSILLYGGFNNRTHVALIVIISIVLTYVSILTWANLYRRAYRFRKNACEIIAQNQRKTD